MSGLWCVCLRCEWSVVCVFVWCVFVCVCVVCVYLCGVWCLSVVETCVSGLRCVYVCGLCVCVFVCVCGAGV